MSRELSLDPELLKHGAGQFADVIESARTLFATHEADLDSASEGWIGSSAEALKELGIRWRQSHSDLHDRVGNIHQIIQTASGTFLDLDGDGTPDVKISGETSV